MVDAEFCGVPEKRWLTGLLVTFNHGKVMSRRARLKAAAVL
jgi:hypothetical protein